MTASDLKPHLSREHCLDLLSRMIRVRRFEDKCAELYTQQKIRGFLHLYDGEEAVATGVIPLLGAGDRLVATYREHGHALVRGEALVGVICPPQVAIVYIGVPVIRPRVIDDAVIARGTLPSRLRQSPQRAFFNAIDKLLQESEKP